MLIDGHMISHALKQWANGAAFHAQMLIHMARLQKQKHDGFIIAKDAAISATYCTIMTFLNYWRNTWSTKLQNLYCSPNSHSVGQMLGLTFVMEKDVSLKM